MNERDPLESTQSNLNFFSNSTQEAISRPIPHTLTHSPLAERMRPVRLEEFIGQTDLLSPESPLRKTIESDAIQSMIFWGPPGTGKTSLARMIAFHTQREFIAISAVMSGIKDIKESLAKAQYNLRTFKKQTILFIDEIHRFNKSQQDALLPFVEDGTVTLIGATTENPSFELNSALLSRAPVYVLKSLDTAEIIQLLNRALSDITKGLGKSQNELPEEWKIEIAQRANGDARRALTLLERISQHVDSVKNKKDFSFSDDTLKKALGAKTLRYDTHGEEHYNTISAFIKSMRDSDPDAALYYLARMIEAGEDPLFIARRMVIFASEDIGNADPRAIQISLSIKEAVDFVGMPEARICLAQGVTYLASAPKSNASYMGIEEALSDVRTLGNLEVPLHIRNAPTALMKKLDYGKNYKYAHSQESGFSEMSNLPDTLKHKQYYKPRESGLEKQIKEKLDYLRGKRK